MFSLQEYQHVHLLWFKKWSFTLVWKPNPPLRSVRCAHLRADAASINQALLKAPLFTWSVKSFSCYNVLRLCSVRCMKQTLWSSADHALAQVRLRQIFTRTISKKWSQMRLPGYSVWLLGCCCAVARVLVVVPRVVARMLPCGCQGTQFGC